jgi:predicted LPLAT superfamily acyltransferase
MSALSTRKGWLDVAEVGSVWGIRFVAALCTWLGRAPARAFVRLLALYYLCVHATARRASKEYLSRVFTGEVRGSSFRHFATFADVTVDRILFAAGKLDRFVLERTGHHHLEALARDKRGALLIGAHLGSFEAMGAGARFYEIPINMVMNFKNAARIQAVLHKLTPERPTNFISIGDGGVDFVFRIRDRVEHGELVAMHADRVGPDQKMIEVDFLGGRARFAAGPFILASVLHCPVYLTVGLFHGENRYELVCEPLFDQVVLPRQGRQEALRALVQAYAHQLEQHVHRAPYNWFNFYDFWSAS